MHTRFPRYSHNNDKHSSTVIEYLKTKCKDKPSNRIAYFYFDFNDMGKKRASGCLRSLVHQFCNSSDLIPEAVLSFYENSKSEPNPPDNGLAQALAAMLSETTEDYIIIDGLDEFDEDERRHLFLLLRDIKASSAETYRIFVASRPESDIRYVMEEEGLSNRVINVEKEKVDRDIRLHVRSCLSNDRQLKKWKQSVKDEIEEALTRKSNGM